MSQSPDIKEETTEKNAPVKKTRKKAEDPETKKKTSGRSARSSAVKKDAAEEAAQEAQAAPQKTRTAAKKTSRTRSTASKAKSTAEKSTGKEAVIPASEESGANVRQDAEPASEAPAAVKEKKARSASGSTRKTTARKKKADAVPDSPEAPASEEQPAKKSSRSKRSEDADSTAEEAKAAMPASDAPAERPAVTDGDDASGTAPAPRGRRKTVRRESRPSAAGEEKKVPAGKKPEEDPAAASDGVKPAVREAAAEDPADAQPAWTDDGPVTNILPFQDPADDVRSHRRIRRDKRQPAAQPDFNSAFYPAPFEQAPSFDRPRTGKRKLRDRRPRRQRQAGTMQAFDLDYNAALYDDSILGAAQSKLQETAFYPEDDGPQPVLPGQPQAADFTSPAETDYAALDNAVNGNRASSAAPSAPKESRMSRRTRKPQREGRSVKADAAGPEEKADAKKVRRILYLSVVPNEQAEVVITEDGQVAEYFVEMSHQVKIRGNIYKGVINNIDANLQAAFVNFGNGKNGFLQIDEVHPEYYLTPHDETQSGSKYPPIQKALKVGQEVLVQIVKEPAGSKGAFLTTWISIAGRFLVLTPGKEQIGVSRKVTDMSERARLKELLNGIQPGENMGVIIRTASEGADKESIQQDLVFLKKLYEEIKEKASSEKSPSLIYQEADLVSRSVRDYLSDDIAEIWTDDEETQKRVAETAKLLFPGKDLVRLHKDQRHGMWERFNILKQLESVTSREVLLPSGGRLVFDQTEALMAIDINSGKTQGKTNFESMVFRTNMEAAEAIARHLRLRDIGGQVVIDFIEMRDKSHCTDVERALRSAMRRDKACHDVGRMSSFGLLELVRQRTGTSAISISTEPCPHCHGTGLRRNMEWQALHTLRDMEIRMAKIKDGAKSKKNERRPADNSLFQYECGAELALYILNRKRDRIDALEEKFGMRIEVQIK